MEYYVDIKNAVVENANMLTVHCSGEESKL